MEQLKHFIKVDKHGKSRKCPHCQGTGSDRSDEYECRYCQGTGKDYEPDVDKYGN